jgi:peptidoglycan/xylan/chitin deacetylase (PgdA/CDA1 family)
LTFHALEGSRDNITFPPALFRSGLAALAARGLCPERLEGLAARLRDGEALPPSAFALTFDDGYRTVYTEAFPVLAELGMTATVFLCTGAPARAPLAGELPPMGGRPLLTWSQIREMHRAGIAFGAHTLTHPDLTRLDPAAVETEIRESQARIEDALGSPVRAFAYPFGRFNGVCRDLAARYFDLACTDRLALATARSDRFALPRVDACYLRRARLFFRLPLPLLQAYVAARAVPRGLRRGLGGGFGG